MKIKIKPSFVDFQMDAEDEPIRTGSEYLKIRGSADLSGTMEDVSFLLYRDPGAFESPEHEASYRELFDAMEGIAAFQQKCVDDEDTKGMVAKISRLFLVVEGVPGQRGMHKENGRDVPNKYVPLTVSGPIDLGVVPAPAASIAAGAAVILKTLK